MVPYMNETTELVEGFSVVIMLAPTLLDSILRLLII
jgi:hypothetical protein